MKYNFNTLFICFIVFITCVSSIRVMVLIPGSSSDEGYAYQILNAVLELRVTYPSPNVIDYIELDLTTAACVTTANAVAPNYDLVFLPTGSWATCAQMVAPAHPATKFVVQNSGVIYPGITNLAADYKPGVYNARYISGALCGAQPQVSLVCFMCPFFYSQRFRWSNAILLGMKHTHPAPGISLLVGYTNDFNHQPSESKVLLHFIAQGCDVIIQHQDTSYPMKVAAAADIWGIGWASDMRQFAGENVLTSIVFNWTVSFDYYIKKVIAGTFISEIFGDTLDNGGIDMAPYSSEVTFYARIRAWIVEQRLRSGAQFPINPFCGIPVFQKYHTWCTTDANLGAEYLPGISVYNGTVPDPIVLLN